MSFIAKNYTSANLNKKNTFLDFSCPFSVLAPSLLLIKPAEVYRGTQVIVRKEPVGRNWRLFLQPRLLWYKDCLPWPPLQLSVAVQPGCGQQNMRGNGLRNLGALIKSIPDIRCFLLILFSPDGCRHELSDPGNDVLSIAGPYNKKNNKAGRLVHWQMLGA